MKRKRKDNISEMGDILDGRTHSSPAPSYRDVNNHIQTTRPAAARFSALQDTANQNISPMESDVNMTIEELLKKWRSLLGF